MKKLFFISILILVFAGLQAQQDPMISQYMFNGLFLNPAYAGSKSYMRSSLLHRSQWVGIDGAPNTEILSVEGPLRDEKSALGVIVSNDYIGITNRADILVNYSYSIRFNNQTTLALGLRGGLAWHRADFNKLIYWDNNDQIYQRGILNSVYPEVGSGLYYYGEKFYLGASVPHVLSYDPKEWGSLQSAGLSRPRVRRHYFFNAGYVFNVSSNVALKPSVLVKYVYGAPVEADFNLNVLLAERFWVGASFRTKDALVAILEFQVTPKLRIGYAYDYTITELQTYTTGTHEIMIGYDFGWDAPKVHTPRYF